MGNATKHQFWKELPATKQNSVFEGRYPEIFVIIALGRGD
jgi:hypothetical protein